jgi:hypothetical protein
VKSPLWKCFHVVICVKPGVDESMLPWKWKDNKRKDSIFACCDNCGQILWLGIRTVGKGGKLATQHQSNSSMINHLGSKEHKTTLDLLCDKVESHFFSAGGEKRERSRGKHLLAPSKLP